MKLYFVVFALSWFVINSTTAQISPPGLGKAQNAAWFAVGVRQELDTIEGKGWQSMSYIGVGHKSNPDNYNPFHNPGILVLNQEFYHQFHSNWQYSLALSYRRQAEYLDEAPYERADPRMQQEFRFYSRFSYIFNSQRVKLVPTLRQDFRKFYDPDFGRVDETIQLRTRFRLQITTTLDNKEQHRIVAGSEQLFATSKLISTDTWTGFKYNESRFTLYYSYTPSDSPFIFNIGYMNNLIGNQKPFSVHHLAFDIIIENPFSFRTQDKSKIKGKF